MKTSFFALSLLAGSAHAAFKDGDAVPTDFRFSQNTRIDGNSPSRNPSNAPNANGQKQRATEVNGISAAMGVGGVYQACSSCVNSWLDPLDRCGSCTSTGYAFSTDFCGTAMCDAKTHCAGVTSEDSILHGGDLPNESNACKSGAKANAATADMCDSCGTNQDVAKACATCESGYTNYPYCDLGTADSASTTKWIDGNVCNWDSTDSKALGSINANYFALSAGTTCGQDSCLPTEHCCSSATLGHWTAHPADQAGTANFFAAKDASYNSFCVDKTFTCCGQTACTGRCLDAEHSICDSSNRDEITAHVDREPCYATRLANGTLVDPANQSPTAWCSATETCCDGVCCDETQECTAKGTFNQLTDTDMSLFNENAFASVKVPTQKHPQTSELDAWGFDVGYAARFTPAGYVQKDAKFCHKGANGYSMLRMILLPILLVFSYILAIVLGIHSNSAPPVKIVSLVLLVLCLFNAFSWFWRVGVMVATVATLSNFASGSKAAGSYTPVLVMLAQIIILFVLIGVGNFNIFADAKYNYPIRPMNDHFPFYAGRDTYNDGGANGDFANCFKEFNWFMKDVREMNHDEYLGTHVWTFVFEAGGAKLAKKYTNMFFGYCNPGWLAFGNFVNYTMAVLLFVQLVFVAKFTFESKGTVEPKEAQ